MVRGKNRIPYWIDWRLTGLAEPDYDATISFGLPIEPEDSQYGKYRLDYLIAGTEVAKHLRVGCAEEGHLKKTVAVPFLARHRGSVLGAMFLAWLGLTIWGTFTHSPGIVGLGFFLLVGMPVVWLIGYQQKKDWRKESEQFVQQRDG